MTNLSTVQNSFGSGEIDPRLLLAEAQRRGKDCYLPVLNPVGAPRLRFLGSRAEPYGQWRYRIVVGLASPPSAPGSSASSEFPK